MEKGVERGGITSCVTVNFALSEMPELTPFEKVVFLKFYEVVKGSLKKHPPEEAIKSKFRSDQRRYCFYL